jgi:hypothetical protein
MHRIPTINNHAPIIKSENMVENLAYLSLDVTIEFKYSKSSIQVASTQGRHSLLSLPRLPTRRTNGKEPLMDYSQNHVVIQEKI